MKRLSQTNQFPRDIKRMRKRGKNLRKLQEVVRLLAGGTPLAPKHRDHPLIGPWVPSRDCHQTSLLLMNVFWADCIISVFPITAAIG